MASRYEQWLEKIANGEQITEEPRCRREIFLKALANKEGTSNLPTPLCREEEYYRSIIAGETITAEPTCKREIFLKAIANGESLPESLSLNSREATLLKQAHAAGVSGGSTTPTTYSVTFNDGVTVLSGSTQLTSGTKVEKDTILTISYTISEGYHLSYFQVNGVDAANNSTITVTSNVNITFAEALNSHSITFSDGVTVLSGTDNVTSGDIVLYGTELTISYTLTDGYELTTFQVNGVDAENNSTIIVTENIDIVFEQTETSSSGGGSDLTFSRTFSENTPEQISAVSAEISANNMTSEQVAETYGWNIGDTIDISGKDMLGNSRTFTFCIIGFNHDVLSDGSGTAGITLDGCGNYSFGYAAFASSTSNSGGYSTSNLKTKLAYCKTLLPTEWQNVIKTVNKVSSKAYNSTEVVTTEEELFPLSEKEVFGTVTNAQNGSQEGMQYEYWKSTSDRAKGDTGWWTRSVSNASSSKCVVVYSGTSNKYISSTSSSSVCVYSAFCV